MTLVDFVNIPALSDPQISPDGQYVLYTLSESDWKANRQISHIWRVELTTQESRQYTYGEKGESRPRWSPDGKWISFLANRTEEGGNQLYLLYTGGGESRALTSHPTALNDYEWAPDGQSIYFTASDPDTEEEKARKERKDDVFAYDEDYHQRHLWRFDLAADSAVRVTEGDYSVLSFELSLDGQSILWEKGLSPLYDEAPASEIWLMQANGTAARQLTENGFSESGPALSPDGKQVLFTAFANEAGDFYYNNKLFLVPTDGSTQSTVPLPNEKYAVQEAVWSGNSQTIYFHANLGLETQLLRFDLRRKKVEALTNGPHSLTAWDYHPDLDLHVFGRNTATNPGDLYLLENGALRQLTHHYDYLAETFLLPKQERVVWKGADGVEIEGLLHYPIDYEAGQRYPLVVQTHGGPAAADHYGFSRRYTHYHPVFTAQGYATFQPNYRGSTGYGDAFLRDMVGGYFRQAHLDVMAGVDYLIERGIADPDRLIKMGWSAGGHMTNKLITYTNRFKAASSGAGAVNWVSMYGQSDVRTYRTPWFGGTPWQENAPADVYWEHSPLKYVSQVTTPTLVVVGQNDVRVPLPQSVELYRALKSLGIPTHLYVAPREPHGWQELQHRLYKMNVELDWFAKYALDKEYSWEAAPE